MFCSRCKNNVAECECGDIEERLEALADHDAMATKWCENCDSNHARCDCDEPRYTIK